MKTIDDLLKLASTIESKLQYVFKDKSYLALAFVHRSFLNENRMVSQYNERLEFLGDSVLGMLIAEYLYRQLPSVPEGELSYLRSRLVDASSCMIYVQKLDLSQYLLLGKGERLNDRGRESILADLFEAIIGAIFLDGGIEAARQFIFQNFTPEIESILKMPLRNWKAVLQEYSQKNHQCQPVYKVLEEAGPDHSKTFIIAVLINDQEMGRGHGPSKKEAQQAAAADAFSRLEKEIL